MEYDNTDKGALFKNDRKETENHPDYTGKINVGGTDRYLSAWLKTSKSGQKFMSISLGRDVEQKPQQNNQQNSQQNNQQGQQGQQQNNMAPDLMSEDIPF